MEKLVVVKSTTIVRPRNEFVVTNESNRVKKIHLTPWDLVFLRYTYPQRGLFLPKPDTEEEVAVVISKLQTSLSIALHHFYPLAGCLVKEVNEDDDTVSFHISCNADGGAKFVHAAAKTVAMSDLAKSGFFNDVSFFPATGLKNYQGVSNPLLVVQVTELKDAIFVGFGYNHTVADGKSIWKFINAWSEICRSMDSRSELNLDLELTLRGWFLDGIDYPIRIQDPETEHSVSTASSNTQQLEIVFRLTRDNVLKLKAKAGTREKDGKISSLQAALGHIWHSRVKNSEMSREEETFCVIQVDMRQRLNPKLDEECFGNVIRTRIASVNVGELLDRGPSWVALQINKVVSSEADEKSVVIPVSVGSTLAVASSPRFDVYGNDFGWGKPIGLRSGPPHFGGKLVVVQGVDEGGGGFEFQASFPPQVIVKLVNDAEFLEYVDIVSCTSSDVTHESQNQLL